MNTLRSRRGVTLIEALISMAILAVAAAGAFAGLTYSATDLKTGALRQYKMVLLEAKAQRIMAQDKTNFQASAVTTGYPVVATAATNYPPNMPIGTWPAQVGAPPSTQGYDSTAIVPGDLSTGAYFKVLPNGQITQLTSVTTPSVPAGTKCGDPALPVGSYCRETLLTIGPPMAFAGPAAAILPSGTVTMTLWTRVSKAGEPLNAAVWQREVIVQ